MKPDKHLVTVDALILDGNDIVLIRRANDPYKGMWALPGGFVDKNEDTEDACIREAKEETNLDVDIESLSGVYARPDRDPRGHTISVAYICKTIPMSGRLKAADDAKEAGWWQLDELPEMAFDHKKIINEYRYRKILSKLTSEDIKAISEDWKTVGDDMKKAIKTFEDNQKNDID